jgi:hypothetical protein
MYGAREGADQKALFASADKNVKKIRFLLLELFQKVIV